MKQIDTISSLLIYNNLTQQHIELNTKISQINNS